MSAETLRRAAALMRARAEKASPGRYGFTSKWTTPTTMLTRITQAGRAVAEARGPGDSLYDLHHLSYWHPAVALAVADWLDAQADDLDSFVDGQEGWVTDKWKAANTAALAVAAAYLGEAS